MLANWWKKIINWSIKNYQFLILAGILLLAAVARLAFLNLIPSGFNWDETAYAYSAWNIWKTGADEWGAKWPIFLKSFGEYKPALLAYLEIPFLLTIGTNRVAARTTTGLLGVISIAAAYFFLKKQKISTKESLIAILFLAVTPWHIHYSRAAMDPIVGFSLMMLGFWGLAGQSWRSRTLGLLGLLLSMYTYNAQRVFVPLALVLFMFVYHQSWWKKTRWWTLLASWLIGSASLAAFTIFSPANGRLQDLSLLNKQEIHDQVLDHIFRSHVVGLGNYRFFNNKGILSFYKLAKSYSSHFDPNFYFFQNNPSPRHAFSKHGNLLLFTAPWLIMGLIQMTKGRKQDWFWLGWLLLSPLPATFAKESPHSGRILMMVMGWAYVYAQGVIWSAAHFKQQWKQIVITAISVAALLFNFAYYWYQLYLFFPEESYHSWQGDLVAPSRLAYENMENYKQVYLTSVETRPQIFIAWEKLLPAENYQQIYLTNQWKNLTIASSPSEYISCWLAQDDFLVILRAFEMSDEFHPTYKIDYFDRFHKPSPAFAVFETDQISAKDKEKLNDRCKQYYQDNPNQPRLFE